MCVDNKFNKYEVPIFCINEPISYSHDKIEDKDLNMEYEDKAVEVIIRSAKYPNGDIRLNEHTTSEIEIIKSTIKAMKELEPSVRVRLFYNGREMMDEKTLGNYNYQGGTVIQAMFLAWTVYLLTDLILYFHNNFKISINWCVRNIET